MITMTESERFAYLDELDSRMDYLSKEFLASPFATDELRGMLDAFDEDYYVPFYGCVILKEMTEDEYVDYAIQRIALLEKLLKML